MSPRRRALAAVVAAALLVGVAVLSFGVRPRSHVIVVDLAVAAPLEPSATPRIDRLRELGATAKFEGAASVDDARLEELVRGLVGAGWIELARPGAGAPREVTDEALDAAYAHGPTRVPVHLRVGFVGSAARLDAEVGRLVDGLAGPLRPDRTLYVLVDASAGTVTLAGPPGVSASDDPRDGEGVVAWISRIAGAR